VWLVVGVSVLLLGAGWVDLRERRIPNALVVPAAAIGLCSDTLAAGRLPVWGLSGVIGAAVTIALWLGCEAVPWTRGSLGEGDAKLLATLCLLLGPVVTLAVASCAMTGMSVYLAARWAVGRRVAGSVPFGPALAGAWLMVLLVVAIVTKEVPGLGLAAL